MGGLRISKSEKQFNYMFFTSNKVSIIRIVLFFTTFLFVNQLFAQSNEVFSVQINTELQYNPPALIFSWIEDMTADSYFVYKRSEDSTDWKQPIAVLTGDETQFIDFDIQVGEAFEYAFYKTPSFISDTVTVSPGSNLLFTINDSWGDGICCNLGFGYYKVYTEDSLFCSGGEFTFSDSVSFEIPGDYPSDTDLIVYIFFDSLPEETSWTLSDIDSGIELASGDDYDTHRFTYVFAGIDYPITEDKGTILLIVDDLYTSVLDTELKRFETDLICDGLQVKRIDISRDESVTNIKALITDVCNNDSTIKTLFLIGHIPVPYSGNFAMDGHSNHIGAWPSDVYYAELDGVWTDNSVNTTSASRPENHNVPGDGKFDQSFLPSDADIEVGRIDMYNLPAFSENEIELTRRYLEKNHNFRVGNIETNQNALIDEGLSQSRHAVGWRNFAPLVGASHISALDYLPTLEEESYLWSFGCGGSSYTSCGGIASTYDFASKEIYSVFTMLFGSYFGDWDNENNVLRSPLASNGTILANMWACVPHWYIHPMGLGKTIGYCTKLSQNNSTEYTGFWGNRVVHTALMGDPTLKMHIVKPISNLTVDSISNSEIILNWLPPEDTVLGYNIYRSDSINKKFIKLNQTVVIETEFTDKNPISGNNIYMVRAIKLQRSGSGSYFNLSSGVIDPKYTTEIRDNFMDNTYIIYPNPADDFINIQFNKKLSFPVRTDLYSVSGNLLKTVSVSSNNYELNISDLPSGIIILKIISESEIISYKLIKK